MRYSRIVLGVLLGGLGVVAGCGRDKKSSASPFAPEEQTYTLTVFADSSLVGEPRSGVTTRPAGERVFYRYEPASGFRNAVVAVDSAVAPLVGTVTMNGNRQLLASAEKIIVVPAEDMPVVEAAQQVLTSPDSATYQRYISEIMRLYEQYSREEARQRAQAVSSSVFGSADFSAIQAMQAALDGKVFDFGEASAVSTALAPTTSGSGAQFGLDAIYVNGMFTPEEDAPLGALELKKVIREAQLPLPVRVRLFYNASAFKKAGLQEYCVVKSLVSSLITFNAVNLVTGFIGCVGGAALKDVAEATRQLLALISYADFGLEEKVKRLAEMIQESRSRGRAVILVGHSQGTLMAQRALNVLAGPDRCVTAVSLAGPLGFETWGLTNRELTGFVVQGSRLGDLVLRLGLNNFPRLETEITRAADRLVAATTIFPVLTQLSQEWRLHLLLGSYFKATESREQTGKLIGDHSRTLIETFDCHLPAGVRIYASSGRVIGGANSAPSDLWIVPPRSNGVDTLVARIRTADGFEPVITDVAIHPIGSLWGVSFDVLYWIDKETGEARPNGRFTGLSGVNALAFDSQGRMYAADNEGSILGIEFQESGPKSFWSGWFGSGYGSSGDLAFSPDGTLYATVSQASGPGLLVKVDLTTGRATPVSGEAIGFSRVWGLLFVGNVLFGLTSDPVNGNGALITIDTETGRGTFVRDLSFNAFGASAKSPGY